MKRVLPQLTDYRSFIEDFTDLPLLDRGAFDEQGDIASPKQTLNTLKERVVVRKHLPDNGQRLVATDELIERLELEREVTLSWTHNARDHLRAADRRGLCPTAAKAVTDQARQRASRC
jgi:hypothetical protein